MKIVIVGSGTGIPLADRGSPCILLISGAEYNLFDLGPGSLRRLARLGIPHQEIDRVILTHFHPDHSADLVHFLFATNNPSVLKEREPFLLAGPKGLKKFLGGLQKAYGRWLNVPPSLLGMDELDLSGPDRRSLGKLDLFSLPLRHTPNSLAYRVEEPGGGRFVYSGDTGYSEELIEFAQGADLLVLECSFPEEDEDAKHLTPVLAGRIAARSRARRLLLLHFYPEVLATDIARQCRLAYQGELILGRDSLGLDVG